MVAPGDAFQHYFWGDKNAGYDVLLTNMKQGVTATKEFHEILRERANYEEAFSKSLRRLSEKASAITAVGSFLPVWIVIKKYIENMSKIHGDFSTRFKELCQELNNYKVDSGSKTNKSAREHSDVVKTHNSLNNIKTSLEHVNKCKKLYHQKHKELVESEETLNKVGTETDKTDKEQEKIQQKFTKSQDAFTAAENTYKTSVEKYNKVQEEYNDDMTNSCKYFGEVEQTHLNSIVEFAKRFGDIETDLVDELKKNCESILGGLVGYTPENLIEIFVEDKKTGVEMAPLMEPELLTIKDPPILAVTPKPLDKSSDSGSVNSLPNIPNATTTSAPPNMNTMTLAMSNVSMKAFRNMLKSSKPSKSKPKNKSEADSKSIDSKNSREEENGGDDLSVENTGSEQDYYERHATTYFSSDDDVQGDDSDSDEDGLTAKVRTIKIRNPEGAGEATEEQLRKATEKLTLSCLSPNTCHRDRSKTHNPQLFSAYSHSLVDLPVSPEPHSISTFPTTFNTPRAKSVSGNLSSPRASPRRFPETDPLPETAEPDNAWAVFDESFKAGKRSSDSNVLELTSWSTPPTTKRNLFDQMKVDDIVTDGASKDNGIEGLLEFAPTNVNTPGPTKPNQDIEDLLSITIDTSRAISPTSEYMTPESSPTNHEEEIEIRLEEAVEEEKEEEEGRRRKKEEKEEEEEEEEGGGVRKKRLPSLIEFSPVRLGNQEGSSDPLSSTQRSEDDIVGNSLPATQADNGEEGEVILLPHSGEGDSAADVPLTNDIDVEDSKLLSPLNITLPLGSNITLPLSKSSSLDDCEKANGLLAVIKPTLVSLPKEHSSSSPDIILNIATTQNVAFSSKTEETVESDREEMVYPIAIAIIETTNAMFKADEPCTSKVEGELIMSIPCDAAILLSTSKLPPSLKIRLTSTITPNSFIVNRQIFSIKPPSISDTLELNMNLLQDFLRKRLENIGCAPRINIPLLKYYSPVLKEELAPLIANSFWTTSGDQIILSIDVSVNKTLAEQNFHFPRIIFANSLSGNGTVLQSSPNVETVNNVLKWERLDVGNEMVDNPDRLMATFGIKPALTVTPTHIEFEVEGVVISGTDIVLEDSESYCILTTVKKMKSGKYWTEPKVIDSNC